jgi:transcriptional regulator with XRE-family HTH domain
MSQTMKQMGGRLRTVRKTAGLTQTDFAAQIGIHRGYLANMERGEVNAPNHILRLIALTYKVSFDWLLDGAGEMAPGETTPAETCQFPAPGEIEGECARIEDGRRWAFIRGTAFGLVGGILAGAILMLLMR